MKGIVFTEFLEMVEGQFGMDMVDELIEETRPGSGGVYIATGTYEHTEIIAYVLKLSEKTRVDVHELIHGFGAYLFGSFRKIYPRFFEAGEMDGWAFLKSVDSYIHVEVRKLYPDAELPGFTCRDLVGGGMEMVYESSRHFEQLAHGMIEACMKHFGHDVEVKIVERDGEITVFQILSRVVVEG